jgi:hypothetical protein
MNFYGAAPKSVSGQQLLQILPPSNYVENISNLP